MEMLGLPIVISILFSAAWAHEGYGSDLSARASQRECEEHVSAALSLLKASPTTLDWQFHDLSDLNLSIIAYYSLPGSHGLANLDPKHVHLLQTVSKSFSLSARCFEAAKAQLIEKTNALPELSLKADLSLTNKTLITALSTLIDENSQKNQKWFANVQMKRFGGEQPYDSVIRDADFSWLITLCTAVDTASRKFLVENYPIKPSYNYATLEEYQVIKLLEQALSEDPSRELRALFSTNSATLDVNTCSPEQIETFMKSPELHQLLDAQTPAGIAASAWKLFLQRHGPV